MQFAEPTRLISQILKDNLLTMFAGFRYCQKNVHQALLNLEASYRLFGFTKSWANSQEFSSHVFNWVSVMNINNKTAVLNIILCTFKAYFSLSMIILGGVIKITTLSVRENEA